MISFLINDIVENLSSTSYFKGYKYRKKDSRFINRTSDGFDAIELQYWDGFDLKRDSRALVVKPLYLKRFDVLHKWFEKYSFKSLVDQRSGYSIGFEGNMIGKDSDFYFLLDRLDFEKDFTKFKDEIIANSQSIFTKYATLEDLYYQEVYPILQGDKGLPNVGADWVFEYLKLCKLIDPINYIKLKELVLKQVEVMYKRGEPNISEYYSNLMKILVVIENEGER